MEPVLAVSGGGVQVVLPAQVTLAEASRIQHALAAGCYSLALLIMEEALARVKEGRAYGG